MKFDRMIIDLARDVKGFGVRCALAYRFRMKSAGEIAVLDVPPYGKIAVRPANSDFATVRQTFRDDEYHIHVATVRRQMRDRYDRIIAGGDVPVIIDAGANIGVASVWFAHHYPAARVVAIEPDPDNAAMLRRNVEHRPSIMPMAAAIGSSPGFVSTSVEKRAWAVQTARADHGVPIVTIDEAVAQVPRGRLFIAKIDIEGFESDLFAGNTDWIDDAFAVYIEPHDWMLPGKGSSRNFQRAFGTRDFEMIIVGENIAYVRAPHAAPPLAEADLGLAEQA